MILIKTYPTTIATVIDLSSPSSLALIEFYSLNCRFCFKEGVVMGKLWQLELISEVKSLKDFLRWFSGDIRHWIGLGICVEVLHHVG